MDERTLLEDEIKQELEDLRSLEFGSKEHLAAVEATSKLYRTLLEAQRDDADYEDKCHRKEMELKQQELELEKSKKDDAIREEQKKERRIEKAVDWGFKGVSLLTLVALYCKGLKFEETGIVGSLHLKTLIGKINPLKFLG